MKKDGNHPIEIVEKAIKMLDEEVESKYVSDTKDEIYYKDVANQSCWERDKNFQCKRWGNTTYTEVKKKRKVNIYSDYNVKYNVWYQGKIVAEGITPSIIELPIEEKPYIIEWVDKKGKVRTKNVKIPKKEAKAVVAMDGDIISSLWIAGILDAFTLIGWVVDMAYFRSFDWTRYSEIPTPYSEIIYEPKKQNSVKPINIKYD